MGKEGTPTMIEFPPEAVEAMTTALLEGQRRKSGPGHVFTVVHDGPITRELAAQLAEMHAKGLHAEFKREACPECWPPEAQR
jgi:hypothetical protein